MTAAVTLLFYFVAHEASDWVSYGTSWAAINDTLWDGYQHLPGLLFLTVEMLGVRFSSMALVAWFAVYFSTVTLVAG
jgi:hypothetical protein